MYNARYLQPRPRTGSDTVLHLKPFAGLSTTSTLFDYSLNSHPGTLKGTSALKFPGCDFDGDSDYIEVADHADFSPALTPFSISAWAYMDDASFFWIVTKGVYNTDGEWNLYADTNDKLLALLMDESVVDCFIGRNYSSAITAYQGQWVHVLVTYSGGTANSAVKLYLNGVQVDDADSESNPGSFVAVENLTHAVWIGRYSTFYSDGKVDEVIIYTKEVSATEARSIYEQTRSRYGV